MPKIVITGASGFIGRALTSYLLQQGHEVVAVSRNGQVAPGAHNVCVDSYTDLRQLIPALQGAHTLVHLAGRAHQPVEHPADAKREYQAAHVDTTSTVVKASIHAGLQRFILLSSVGVNGNSTTHRAFIEEDLPAPAEPYAMSKYQAEQVVQTCLDGQDMDWVIVRAPLVYGAQGPGNFARLLRWVAHSRCLPLGAVHNQRSFLGLDNLLDFLQVCVRHPAVARQIFLVSDGEDVSTTELLQRTAQIMRRPLYLLPVPSRWLWAAATLCGKQHQAQRLLGSLQINNTKVRTLLDWHAPISVTEGLQRAVAGMP